MGDRALTTLRVGGVPVGTYRDGAELDPTLSPRPYLHPVRTLAGTPVTDACPADHPWHLGVSVALQDVNGWNFWGGPTYVRGEGYVSREDHGRIEHTGFEGVDDDGFVERLRWVTSSAEIVLTERRQVRAQPVDDGWQLELTTTLTNVTRGEVRLGSPATNGRAGAGYGGFSWRLPPAHEPEVRTREAAGERDAHGSCSEWLLWTDRAAGFTLVFTRAERGTAADPWFVRVAEYPGVGVQWAARDPVTLSAGERLTRGLRVLLADGVLAQPRVAAWVAAVDREPDGDPQPAPDA
jgi:Methane oxygenase PmoA